mgnify:CR=1 FL=1
MVIESNTTIISEFKANSSCNKCSKKLFVISKEESIEIIKLNGSVELAPLVGLSDVIVDIVETGKTLYENGLDVLEDVCPLSARFVVNKVSMKMETERIMNIVKQFEERITK